jgi:hypothetical protein
VAQVIFAGPPQTRVPEEGIFERSFGVAHPREACVAEATAHRYAVRCPGDHGEEGYIVPANHFLCDFSYDEDNKITQSPMTKFGNEQTRSTPRWYTLWWLAKRQRGSIDVDMVRDWLSSHFFIARDGQRVDYIWDSRHGWIPAHLGGCTVFNHGDNYPDRYFGSTTDSKIAVLNDNVVYWSFGRPCEYNGLPRVSQIPAK